MILGIAFGYEHFKFTLNLDPKNQHKSREHFNMKSSKSKLIKLISHGRSRSQNRTGKHEVRASGFAE